MSELEKIFHNYSHKTISGDSDEFIHYSLSFSEFKSALTEVFEK